MNLFTVNDCMLYFNVYIHMNCVSAACSEVAVQVFKIGKRVKEGICCC